MRLIDFDKIPFLAIPIAPVVKGESVHYEQGALKEWFDGTQDVEAVPLDRIKEAEAALDNAYEDLDGYDPDALGTYKCRVDEVFSKLIAEVEG
jgi:hypothetical protein